MQPLYKVYLFIWYLRVRERKVGILWQYGFEKGSKENLKNTLASLCRLKLFSTWEVTQGNPPPPALCQRKKPSKMPSEKSTTLLCNMYFAATRFDANTPKIKMSLKQKPWIRYLVVIHHKNSPISNSSRYVSGIL